MSIAMTVDRIATRMVDPTTPDPTPTGPTIPDPAPEEVPPPAPPEIAPGIEQPTAPPIPVQPPIVADQDRPTLNGGSLPGLP